MIVTVTTADDILPETSKNNGKQQHPTGLRFKLSHRSNCKALAQALAKIPAPFKSQIRSVELPLYQPLYLYEWREPQWDNNTSVNNNNTSLINRSTRGLSDLFRAIGNELDHVQSVTFKARTQRGNPFPVSLLTHVLLPGRHRLRYLHVDMVRLKCPPPPAAPPSDFTSCLSALACLAQAMEQQTCLEWVKIKYHRLLTSHSDDSLDYNALNPVLCSLGKIPTLQHLLLVGTSEAEDQIDDEDDDGDEAFPTLHPQVMVEILQSRSLQEIRIEYFSLGAKTIQALSTALQQNNNNSHNNLEKLVLGLFPEDHTKNKATYKRFANMLRQNTTLQVLHIHAAWSSSRPKRSSASFQKLLLALAKALTYNRSLLELQVRHDGFGASPAFFMDDDNRNGPNTVLDDKVEQAFVAALQEFNVSLTSLLIGNQDSLEGEIHHSTMGYYLKLNNLNRKYFVKHYEQVTHDEWVHVLAQAGHDLDCFYYFLRLNPFLCHTTTATATTTTHSSFLRKAVDDPMHCKIPGTSRTRNKAKASQKSSTTNMQLNKARNRPTSKKNRDKKKKKSTSSSSSSTLASQEAVGSMSSRSTMPTSFGTTKAVSGNQRREEYCIEQTLALTQAVTSMIEDELKSREERERKLEREVQRLRKEVAALKSQQQQQH